MRARLAAIAIALLSGLLGACSASAGPRSAAWSEVKGLGHVVVVTAPGAGGPWLLGGGLAAGNGVIHVSIWSAPAPSGPWRQDALSSIPGRDGPNETILGFARPAGLGPMTAFGSRPSPTEGYPRPSTWFASSGGAAAPSWQEVLADRELFGGPNVVAVGEMSSGPHGYFVTGTWIGPDVHVVAAVWRSPDGVHWTRDDTDPAFDAGPGTESYAYDVADGASGLLLGGTTATPTRQDPTKEVGTLWHSTDGTRWTRLPPLPGTGSRLTVRAVRPLGAGWVAGGSAGARPEVWVVDDRLGVRARALPAAGGAAVYGLAVTPGSVLAAGVTPAGAGLVWAASRHGDRLGDWRLVSPPPAGGGWSGASLAVGAGQVVLVMFDDDGSEVWRAPWPG
jgi:hypothetical protein